MGSCASPGIQGIDACEQFFVDGIESWRKSVGLERVVLLGHSFGGQLVEPFETLLPYLEAITSNLKTMASNSW